MGPALGVLLAASVVLCAVLVAFTVGRKLRRDRKEKTFSARRGHFTALLDTAGVDELAVELRKALESREAQVDLVVTLGIVGPGLGEVRRAVLMHAVCAARLEDVLTRQVRSHDPVKRATAILLLSRLRIPDADQIIAPMVRDKDGDVCLVAVRSLGEVGDHDAALVLIEALGVRRLAPERVIERLGQPWAVDAVLDVLTHGGGGPRQVNGGLGLDVSWRPIRASLARALGLASDVRAEDVLRSMLREGSGEERVSAARALASAGTQRSIPDLQVALTATDWRVRAQAAKSLGGLGATTAIPALAAHLGDRAWWVRSASAEALGQLGEPGLAALQRALDDDDAYARDRAREALALQGLGATSL